MAYNTKLISPKDAPTSWKDLLNPAWRGKIGFDMKSFEWYGYILKLMGEKDGTEFMKNLAAQDLKFYSTRTLAIQLVAAGELAMSLSYRGEVELLKDQGAPVEWAGIEPIIASMHPSGSPATLRIPMQQNSLSILLCPGKVRRGGQACTGCPAGLT